MVTAFLTFPLQSPLAPSMVIGRRLNGWGSIDLTAAFVLESAEKVRKAVDLGNEGILRCEASTV